MEHCLQCDINMQCCLQLACHSVAHLNFMNYKFFLLYILCGSPHTPIPHTCSCYAFHKYAPVSHTSMLNLIYLFFHFLWRDFLLYYPILFFSETLQKPSKIKGFRGQMCKIFVILYHIYCLFLGIRLTFYYIY